MRRLERFDQRLGVGITLAARRDVERWNLRRAPAFEFVEDTVDAPVDHALPIRRTVMQHDVAPAMPRRRERDVLDLDASRTDAATPHDFLLFTGSDDAHGCAAPVDLDRARAVRQHRAVDAVAAPRAPR